MGYSSCAYFADEEEKGEESEVVMKSETRRRERRQLPPPPHVFPGQGDHGLEKCEAFRKLTAQERHDLLIGWVLGTYYVRSSWIESWIVRIGLRSQDIGSLIGSVKYRID